MHFVRRAVNWLGHALFLEPGVFEDISDDDNPFIEGLFVIVLIGVAVALLGFIGTALARASSPDLATMKQTVLSGLKDMPWYSQMLQQGGQQALDQFNRYYDLGWQVFPNLFGYRDVAGAALNIVLLPVTLVVTWLLYGFVAHVGARILGGGATLGQTLGTTALATAPYLFSLITFIPFVVVGGVIGTWTLLGRYTALKVAHRMSWQRTLIATLLPGVLLVLLAVLLGAAFGTLVGSLVARGFAQ